MSIENNTSINQTFVALLLFPSVFERACETELSPLLFKWVFDEFYSCLLLDVRALLNLSQILVVCVDPNAQPDTILLMLNV